MDELKLRRPEAVLCSMHCLKILST